MYRMLGDWNLHIFDRGKNTYPENSRFEVHTNSGYVYKRFAHKYQAINYIISRLKSDIKIQQRQIQQAEKRVLKYTKESEHWKSRKDRY